MKFNVNKKVDGHYQRKTITNYANQPIAAEKY